MLSTKLVGKTVKVLAAIQVAAGDENLTGVFPSQWIEVGDVVASRAKGRDPLPQQQSRQQSPSTETCASLELPQVRRSEPANHCEQRKHNQNMPKASVIANAHGNDQDRNCRYGRSQRLPSSLALACEQSGKPYHAQDQKWQGRLYGNCD